MPMRWWRTIAGYSPRFPGGRTATISTPSLPMRWLGSASLPIGPMFRSHGPMIGRILAAALLAPLYIAAAEPDFSPERFRSHVEHLADDKLEGRETGSR